jgi:hypothetical protein
LISFSRRLVNDNRAFLAVSERAGGWRVVSERDLRRGAGTRGRIRHVGQLDTPPQGGDLRPDDRAPHPAPVRLRRPALCPNSQASRSAPR